MPDPHQVETALVQSMSETECRSAPQLPLPANGEVDDSSDDPLVAPFQIITSGSAHYFVKLVEAGTDEEVLTVFVRAGQTAEIKVPLGSFEVRYAAGTT